MRRKTDYFPPLPGDPAPLRCTVPHRVLFSEVDALAIGWHGHAAQFFEQARAELMRRAGLTAALYARHGVGAPVVQLHTDYFTPVLLDECLALEAAWHWTGGARLNVSYRILKEDGRAAWTGYTVQMLFDLQTRTPLIAPPPFFDDLLERWRKGELAP